MEKDHNQREMQAGVAPGDNDRSASKGIIFEGDDGDRRSFQGKKGCRFCIEPTIVIDHKNKPLLQIFISDRYKILPRRMSGNCAYHQHHVTLAVKRARHLALLPYSTAQL